jgi:uncharacterized phage-associated protein
MIKFEYNFTKSIELMAFFAQKIPGVQKAKMMKLVYLADKEHFLRHGYPITGDRQYAMKLGPVPSQCLDVLDGDINPEETFKFLHINNNRILLLEYPNSSSLTESELAVAGEILEKYGKKWWRSLIDETHELPEYKEVFEENTSTFIPYETILKHSGDPKHFRLDRPVISKEMRMHVACPIPKATGY